MTFAQEFTLHRKKLNLSQQEIADKLGMSRTYITLIENGNRLPAKKHISKIAGVLEVKKNIVINWYLADIYLAISP